MSITVDPRDFAVAGFDDEERVQLADLELWTRGALVDHVSDYPDRPGAKVTTFRRRTVVEVHIAGRPLAAALELGTAQIGRAIADGSIKIEGRPHLTLLLAEGERDRFWVGVSDVIERTGT